MSVFQFNIIAEDRLTAARTGTIQTGHGLLETPFFMPVGTYGAVKTLSSREIANLPSAILLSNTYHLYLRPGTEILEAAGGLHRFMGWPGAILTDSGGFQIFSLSGLRKIKPEGVTFKSHLDGSEHFLSPEKVVDIQRSIGSDFMMMLDVCPPGDADLIAWKLALDTTTQWARRGMKHFRENDARYGHPQTLVPIVQGGTDPRLRRQSAGELLELEADLYAIGGLAVGEPKPEMMDTVSLMNDVLPREKPRYLMGVGTPADLVRGIARGVDMFDCVMPTRNARNSQIFTADGKINIRNARYKNDFTPLDDSGFAPMSAEYTRAYVHHLFRTGEILGLRIASQHNLAFYIHIMASARTALKEGKFGPWSDNFLSRYEGGQID